MKAPWPPLDPTLDMALNLQSGLSSLFCLYLFSNILTDTRGNRIESSNEQGAEENAMKTFTQNADTSLDKD